MRKRKNGSGKRLHPATWGCVGCSGITLLMVIVGSFALRGIIQDMAASGDDVALTGPRPVLERVPGGVVRRELTGGQWLEVSSLAWRSDDSLTYVPVAMPSMSHIMEAATHVGVTPYTDEEEMRKRTAEVALGFTSAPVREYSFDDAADRELVNVPENTVIGMAGLAWSPDGRKAVVAIVPPDRIMDAEHTSQYDVLYVMSEGEAGGWQKLTTGHWPQWSPDGEWMAFWRCGQKDKIGSYVIRSDGSGERRVRSSIWGWTTKDGRCVSVYGKTWLEGERGTSAWELRHVSLADGATRQIKPHGEVERLGALSETERGFLRRDDQDPENVIAWVGAIEPASGHVRWLSKNLGRRWSIRAEILGGKALLMSRRSRQDEDGGRDKLAVFSMIDGRLRELPRLGDSYHRMISRGTRIAWVERREATLYGFVPIPVCDIAVLEITRPEELLTGPIPEQN